MKNSLTPGAKLIKVGTVKSQKGMSLMSVLVAVAITGIIAATLATLYENMTQLMLRSNATAEMDNLQRYVQGILSQRELCKDAFAATLNGAKLKFSNASSKNVDVPVLQIKTGATATLVLRSGNPPLATQVTPSLHVSKMQLWNKDANQNDSPDDAADFSATTRDGIAYRIHKAEFAIIFAWTGGNLIGGNVLRIRKLPLLLTVRTSDDEIEFCDIAQEDVQTVNCSTYVFAAAGPTVPVSCSKAAVPDPYVPGYNCPRIGYVASVDAKGVPSCECRDICPSGTPTSAASSSSSASSSSASSSSSSASGPSGGN